MGETNKGISGLKTFSIWTVIKEIYKGKSIQRAIQNSTIAGYKVDGRVADLGARDGKSSIYRFIESKDALIDYFDYYGDGEVIRKINLEEKLNIDDKSYDYTLLIHVLECIYNTDLILSEIKRITKKESLIIIPFFVGYHGQPKDYYRFTHDALERKLRSAGFSYWEIQPYGYGCFTLAIYILQKMIRLKILTSILFLLAVIIDTMIFLLLNNGRLSIMGYIIKANP